MKRNLQGCQIGKHTTEGSKPVPKNVPAPVQLKSTRTTEGKEIFTTGSSTTASLVQPPQFTKPQASSPAPAPEEEDDLSVEVKPGTRCKRKGCKAEFISDEESRLGEGESTVCTYHPSNVSLPIFCDAQILMLSSSLSFMKVARSVSLYNSVNYHMLKYWDIPGIFML